MLLRLTQLIRRYKGDVKCLYVARLPSVTSSPRENVNVKSLMLLRLHGLIGSKCQSRFLFNEDCQL